MSEQVKIAKIQAQAARSIADRELIKNIVANPIFELLAGFSAVELLQRWPQSRPLIGNMQGNMLEAIICMAVAYQQLSPNVPAMLQSGNEIFNSLMGGAGKVAGAALPLALAAAA